METNFFPKPTQTKSFNTEGEQRTLWHLVTTSNNELAFGNERVEPGCQIPEHQHLDAEEILFIYSGVAKCRVGDQEKIVNIGEAVHIPPKHLHSIQNLSNTEPLLLTWTLTPPLPIHQFAAKSLNTN